MPLTLTTRDLDIARLNDLAHRMMIRSCNKRGLYDEGRSLRWFQRILELKKQRFVIELCAINKRKKIGT